MTVADACEEPQQHICTDYASIPVSVRETETPAYWESTLPVTGGNYAERLLAVAQSQTGYTENTRNFIIDSKDKKHYYTRYGA